MQAKHLIHMPVYSQLDVVCSKEFLDSKQDKYS